MVVIVGAEALREQAAAALMSIFREHAAIVFDSTTAAFIANTADDLPTILVTTRARLQRQPSLLAGRRWAAAVVDEQFEFERGSLDTFTMLFGENSDGPLAGAAVLFREPKRTEQLVMLTLIERREPNAFAGATPGQSRRPIDLRGGNRALPSLEPYLVVRRSVGAGNARASVSWLRPKRRG